MTAPTPPRASPVLILPLPKNVVILPGAGSLVTSERIPISTSSRPDLRALLGAAHVRAGSQGQAGRIDSVPVICVPMASPYLGPQGQLLLTETDHQGQEGPDAPEFNYQTSTPSDLFNCAVAVRITAVQGRGKGEISLVVEGHERVHIDEIVKTKPCYEGKVTVHADEVAVDLETDKIFQRLKYLSRHYLSLLKLHSIVLQGSMGISRLARKYDAYIASKTIAESGILSDFMARSLTMTYEDKLQVLAAFDVQARMLKVIELLERHIGNLKGKVEVTPATSISFTILNDTQSEEQAPIWPPPGLQRQGSQSRKGLAPPFLPRGGNRRMPGGQQGEEEPDEFAELQKKLDDAKLSPEAKKVADKEMRRLTKMSPMQAEFSVIRNYLETLAEIPWAKMTHDRLGPETLPRARKQLDEDHYGLEKVKKRLLEYLAVLKLKQSTNEDVDAQIKRTEQEVVSLETQAGTQADDGSGEALADGTTPEATRTNSPVQKEAAEAKLIMLRRKRMVDKSPILLLVGPPGVGKTSLAKSVATALGRKFHRISLGGVRDEAEIRGHRRTYVAALPGLIMSGLKKVGVANPVFLLDEIDKLGMSNNQGDPSAAMLEVLDPEQNSTFVDHFVAVPFDLSKVMFIATANNLDTIPEPLLDRMEMITLPGYTTLEKRHIATQHLIPKQIRTNGLEDNQVAFAPDAVSKIIEHYTREAGVRNLEREIGSVCRAKAVEYADAQDCGKLDKYTPQLTPEDIEKILGMEKFEDELAETTSRPGVVTGLVAFSSGRNGSILFIEMADMPGSGTVQLTGKLGTVLQESVNVALSWVKQHAFDLGLSQDPTKDIMKGRSIHVHCTPGAVDKDGPSSGMAQAIGLISLFSGRAVPPSLAMTGELSLRGRVMPVGGIKEKLIGALRAGVKTVMLPEQNRKDAQDLPQEVKDGLEIIHVGHVWEAVHHVWPKVHFPGERPGPFIDSVL